MKATLFQELGLSAEMLRAVQKLGFEQASPIQAAAIPVLMTGRDVVGQSHTGSGKTAAFAIPAIERLDLKSPGPQVLIICPTRELALQVCEEVHKLTFFKKGIRAVPIYGGQSYDRQFAELRGGAQIVVGTPGRLLDHLRRGTLSVQRLRCVILDEADEMLDMGFRDDIEALLAGSPPERQTVLFSATVPRAIEELIQRYTKTAQRIQMSDATLTVPTVEQVCYEVDRRWKFEALTRLVDLHDITLGIIFANTQRDVIELADHLVGAGYGAESIHGGMPQAARERVMQKFRRGQIRLLVATDVAARGIDVDDVQAVFNFELPYDAEDYVHRIGRTGRAGRSGMALSLVSGRELFQIRNIERLTRQRLRRGQVPSLGEIEDARLHQFLQEIRGTLKAGDFRHYDHVVEALLEEGHDSLDVANALIHRLVGRAKQAEEGQAKPARPAKPAPAMVGAASVTPAAAPTGATPVPARPAREERRAPAAPPVPRAKPTVPPGAAPAAAAPAITRPAAPVRKPASPVAPAPAPAPKTAPPVVEADPGEAHEAPVERVAVATPAVTPSPTPVEVLPAASVEAATPESGVSAPTKGTQPDLAAEDVSAPTPAPAPTSAPTPRPAAVPGAPRKAPVAKKPGADGEITRLWMSAGEEHGANLANVKEMILGSTGEPEGSVLKVDIRLRHTFVDVPTPRAAAILGQLKRAAFIGRRLKVKVA